MTLLSICGEIFHMTIPYACAALGGIYSEKSGVVQIGLEGTLLWGGFVSVAAAVATGEPAWGLFLGGALGAFLGGLHALFVVIGRLDPLLSGIAMNGVALGGTRWLLRVLYHSSSNSPSVPLEGLDVLSWWGLIGTTAAFVLTALAFRYTPFGLRVRAAGENPRALDNAKISVRSVRTLAVMLGGAITGAGGALFALEQRQFQSGMTGGRGFVALAIVILSGHEPSRAFALCLGFATLDMGQAFLQARFPGASYLLSVVPYVAALASFAFFSGKKRLLPSALGKEYVPS